VQCIMATGGVCPDVRKIEPNQPLELGLASTVALAATKTAAGTSAYVRNAAYSASIRGRPGNVG
jgi:hypothetical protein